LAAWFREVRGRHGERSSLELGMGWPLAAIPAEGGGEGWPGKKAQSLAFWATPLASECEGGPGVNGPRGPSGPS
jgi:hypothetical protein